jgi:hypothetical protein
VGRQFGLLAGWLPRYDPVVSPSICPFASRDQEWTMPYAKIWLAMSLTAGLILCAAGCNGTQPATNSPTAGEEHGHEGHDHAHDHSHAHGLHGGHIIEIGEEEYHAEWTHDDSGKVTVYILDAEMKKEVPIEAEEITIDTVVAGQTNSFQLAAVDRTAGDMPKASKFEIVDQKLLGVLESLSEGVTATLKMTINGKPYEAKITHDDHGHKH